MTRSHGHELVRMLEAHAAQTSRVFEDPLEEAVSALLVGMVREQGERDCPGGGTAPGNETVIYPGYAGETGHGKRPGYFPATLRLVHREGVDLPIPGVWCRDRSPRRIPSRGEVRGCSHPSRSWSG